MKDLKLDKSAISGRLQRVFEIVERDLPEEVASRE